MKLTVRPIDEYPDQLADSDDDREPARFSASWSDTVDLLDRELRFLGADEAVLQMAVTERDCRLDGWIRADAKPAHPGVILSFESTHGPLRYWTDRYRGAVVWEYPHNRRIPGWQCNVRAIALGLEALRKVDRYGIARNGEQYRGWNALPPGTPMPAAQMTVEEAADLLAATANKAFGDEWCLPRSLIVADDRVDLVRGAYRDAVRIAHPDAGGDPELFRRLTEARDLLLGAAP